MATHDWVQWRTQQQLDGAVAGAVPERVSGHSLLGAMASLAEKAQWRAAGKDMKMAAFMSRRAPFLLRAGFKQQYKKLPDSAMGLFKGHWRS